MHGRRTPHSCTAWPVATLTAARACQKLLNLQARNLPVMQQTMTTAPRALQLCCHWGCSRTSVSRSTAFHMCNRPSLSALVLSTFMGRTPSAARRDSLHAIIRCTPLHKQLSVLLPYLRLCRTRACSRIWCNEGMAPAKRLRSHADLPLQCCDGPHDREGCAGAGCHHSVHQVTEW